MESPISTCHKCGTYHDSQLRQCPVCRTPIQSDSTKESQVDTSPTVEPQSPDGAILAGLLRENIKASNRTTHAVRAAVRFLLVQLAFITLAAFAYQQSQNAVNPMKCYQSNGESGCSESTPWMFAAGLIWLVGVVVSSNLAWRELAASDVPGENSGKTLKY